VKRITAAWKPDGKRQVQGKSSRTAGINLSEKPCQIPRAGVFRSPDHQMENAAELTSTE
jgi:hypothetical protein